MTISGVSTLAIRQAAMASASRTQVQLERASREVSSGRHYDVGLKLGLATGRVIGAREAIGELDAIASTNELARSRMAVTEASLDAIADIASGFFETIVSASRSGVDRAILVEDARARLGTVVELLGASSDGAYVFSGTNTSEAPLADYLGEPMPASRSAVIAAFSSEFGFAPDDAQAATISQSQLQDYLDGSFQALFQDAAWRATFSTANGEAVGMRISPSEVASIAVNANDAGVRGLVASLVAVIDTGTASLDERTFQSLTESLAERVGAATGELTRMRSVVGMTQERLAKASERMIIERGILERVVGSLEGVDTLEASTRLELLATQLDVSYAVTARIQKLSLLDYL